MHTHGTGREEITRVRATVRAHAGCEVGRTRDAGAAIVGLQTPWKVAGTTLLNNSTREVCVRGVQGRGGGVRIGTPGEFKSRPRLGAAVLGVSGQLRSEDEESTKSVRPDVMSPLPHDPPAFSAIN